MDALNSLIEMSGPMRDSFGHSAFPWAYLLVAATILSGSGAMVRWPSVPMPFPPRPRLQQQHSPGLLTAQLTGVDATPEDYMIDQLVAYLQQAERVHTQNSRQKNGRQEPPLAIQGVGFPYESDEEGVPSRDMQGQGLGFTYRFPEQGEPKDFAINPSDPDYYRGSDKGFKWETMGEVKGSEGGGGSFERSRLPLIPLGRFPLASPVKMSASSGTENPPLRYVEEAVLRAASLGHGDLRMSSTSNERADAVVSHHRTAGGSSVPPEQVKREKPDKVPLYFGSEAYLTAIISGCAAAVVVGLIAFAIFWYRLQRNAKAAADVEYPAYGVTGPNQEASAVAAAAAAASIAPTPHSGGSTSPLSAGDRRLAQSAQMYHYQHQKQQIIAMESRASNERRGSVSEVDSEEENEEGDYTVYECPGLAPTGEMEVKNPLFHDDPTPATPGARGSDGCKP